MSILVVFALLILAILARVINKRFKRAQRNKLFFIALEPIFIRILIKNVSIYSLLPDELRKELHGRINIFLDEKKFIAHGGLVISDEICITIAGNACLLLIGQKTYHFTGVKNIFVYPNTYVAKQVKYDGLVQITVESTRAGESWQRGPIVLSWADVLRGSLKLMVIM